MNRLFSNRISLSAGVGFRRRGHQSQRGVVLIIGLILLLLLSLLGAASMKMARMEESMAGNTQDRTLAFQAAEAALREAEVLLQNPALPAFSASNGMYRYQDADAVAPEGLLLSADNARVYTQTLPDVAAPPLYILEQMAAAPLSSDSLLIGTQYGSQQRFTYRITALGFGGSASTKVVLRASYKR
jgi:type IV pilus assembly protein PilX